MPTRDEMIAALQAQDAKMPSRDQMIAELQQQDAGADTSNMGGTERVVRAVGSAVAPIVAPVGRAVDRFTGAPVRSAISAAQNGQNPAQAFMNQFGSDPDQAPTGKEIAQKAGLGETSLSDMVPSLYAKDGKGWALRKGGMLDPTASGAAGLGIDIAADPLNLVGVGEVADLAKASAKAVAKPIAKGIQYAAKGADAVTGVKAATAGIDAAKGAASTTGKVYEAARKSIDSLLKPSLAADSKNMEAIAAKHGIPAELISPAHEFGDASSITRLQRTVAEGALGQKYLDSHNAGLMKTTQALEKDLTTKFGHAPAQKAEAGAILKDAVDAHISRVFDEADLTYRSAAKKFPGIKFDDEAMQALQSKAIGMQREAANILRTSADPTQLAQAKNLEAWAGLIQKAKGSYKQMSEVMQNVGKAAYAKTPLGQIPSDVKKLRELYSVGSEGLIQSIRNTSAAAADELVKNNLEIREMLGDKSLLGKAIAEASTNPEKIYTSLVEHGGSKQIETLKKILPPETFNQMRSRYLADLVKYSPEKDFGHLINFKGTRSAMEKASEKLSYMFTPEELKDATELLKFGERYGSPVMSSSGTGGSQGLKQFAKNLVTGGQDEHALEYMKAKARGKAPAAAPGSPPVSTPAGTPPSTAVPSPPRTRPLFRDRGPVESRLKAAQSVSPSLNARPRAPKSTASDQQEEVSVPTKGPEKWANDGFEKLKQHGVGGRDPATSLDGLREKLMADPQGRALLYQASDLKPGSKGMQKIMERIQQLYGSSSSVR